MLIHKLENVYLRSATQNTFNLDHTQFKVCHITSAHPDGDIRIFHKSCVSLANAGFETYCVVPNAKTRLEKNVHIIGFEVNVSSRWRRFLFAVRGAYKTAAKLNADVYHLHDPELLLIARKLKRKTGAKVIFDSHEDVPKQIMDKSWIPSFLRKTVSNFYAAIERRICRKLDAVISVTPIICARFASFHNKVALVANFPDLAEFDLETIKLETKQKNTLCYVGGIFRTRGIYELVQAMDDVDAQLLLAGKFESAQFEAEVRALPSWNKVVFYGHIDRLGVRDLLASSSVGVVTLKPTASYKEAYPIKMFEYMAAGIAVLASDFPLWRDLVEKHNCAQFVDPCDPKKIASALEQMFKSPDLHAWGQNGRKAIESNINWSMEAEKLVALYQDLLSEKHHKR
jgi:glycosyltransferase involved in cell wall biosynthesis